MKLAIIILAHQRPEQVGLLASRLRHPGVRLYLHVERRAPLAPFRRALQRARANEVRLLPRYAAPWGSPGCVDAELAGLRLAVADGCDYFMLISGQDLPVRPVQAIYEFAQEASSRSYIEHWPLHTSRHRFAGRDRTDFYSYTLRGTRRLCIPRGEDVSHLSARARLVNQALRLPGMFKPPRRFPDYIRPFAGATWWNISREAADHVLAFVAAHPDYRRYHEHTWVPEEIFVQSILAGTAFAERHVVIGDALRFYEWEEMHARVLTSADLPALAQSSALFARKFDKEVDAAVLEQLHAVRAR